MENTCENQLRSCLGCEDRSPLFCHLTEDETRTIDRNKIRVHFRRGETIRKQGTGLSHVVVVNSGLAKLYLEGIDRKNAIIRIVKPTNFIGGPGIYLDQRHHFTVSALTDTDICFIDLGVFTRIIDSNRTFRQEFLKDLSSTVLSAYTRMINLTQKQRPGRMADTLIYLSEDIFSSTGFDMLLSRQELAELSAMTKDSAIRILSDFQSDGVIKLSGNNLEIVNMEKLQRISRLG